MSSRKRVLFIERNLRNEKLGIMYLAGSLKAHGHHAEMVQADREDLDERVREYRPDFLAFSVTTGEHVHALRSAREVKDRHGIPNIFGGPHCTFFPEIAREPDVDFVVQGQGERAIVDVVEGRIARGFYKAPMADHLDDLPSPDRGVFYRYAEFRDNPMKNVITSRACPYKCSYCFNHSQLALARIDGETRQWFTRQSVENVVTEICELGCQYPLDKVLFIDDSFIQNRSWLGAFVADYAERVGLPWLCSVRVNCLDDALAERLFAAGLEMVNYAVESADPVVQQRLLNRGHISNRDVIRAISLFNRFGIRARMQNMIGLPLTNPLEDALNTLQFNMRHRVTDSWCSIFQPYPRTALGQYCVDHGFISPDQLQHCSESFFDHSRLNLPNKNELYALQKLWYFIVEGGLPLDLVQILIRGEFPPHLGKQLQDLRFHCSRDKLYGLNATTAGGNAGPAGQTHQAVSPPRTSTSADDPPPVKRPPESHCGLDLSSPVDMGECTGVNDHRTTDRALLEAALGDAPLPQTFIGILAEVRFGPREREQLAKYVGGERILAPPLYTVNDDTGELIDPTVSIYTRGTPDPEASDIRRMPEEHFMCGMADVRDELANPLSSPR